MSTRLMTAIANRDSSTLVAMSGNPPTNVQSIVNPEAEKLVDALFRQLKQVFPAAGQTNLKSESDESAAKKQWIAAFAEGGIRSREQVSAGMQRARASASPFLPSPGQFIAWCKEGALRIAGLPDEDELYLMVVTYGKRRGGYVTAEDYPWVSNAAYWMVTSLYDGMRNGNWSEPDLGKAGRKELQAMAKRIESGESIPKPQARLPVLQVRDPLGGDRALSKIAEIRAKHGLKGGDR
ncbi:DNA replication protein [Yersinia ruckeri]|uniref:replication protein P n=1 Tax=Yersinia ruckeri TaxID=29486 RepID=UPI0004E318CD|nr:replication protein P [Yersinia ruckeri]ARZ01776.1 DNA replication protein [Yersinia ruckeri]KFE38534.1 DNA replication protein [Yersinia ruckeri]OJB98110.1 DNA replication protein [Yersinia ruckeri]OJC07067.1 DNA replication protein [Yersinia ruckeri]OJC09660.1 DNA replication protein [Yersinia ruckeri]